MVVTNLNQAQVPEKKTTTTTMAAEAIIMEEEMPIGMTDILNIRDVQCVNRKNRLIYRKINEII